MRGRVERSAALPCVAALLALGGCATRGASGRSVLDEFRPARPVHQLGQPAWLATFTSDELYGRLSRDGRRLLYAGSQKGSLDIWIKDLTTGVPLRVTSDVSAETQPAWAPDDRSLVYVSTKHDVKGDLVLWREGRAERLTGLESADSFPAFSPDGQAIYYAAGPEGQSRIVRVELATRRTSALTGWGCTHPAPSTDGRYLAFTRFDEANRGRLALLRLSDGQLTILTTGDYHAGFPSFSPDGQRLVFSRFHRGAPGRGAETGDVASLWELDLRAALAAPSPAAAMALARQLTSDRYTALFPQVHAAGVVFTSQRGESLDVGLLPLSGLVPRLASPRAQLALALKTPDPWDRLLGLGRVVEHGPGLEAERARYEAATLYRELGELDKAEAELAALDRGATRGTPQESGVAWLARIDLAALPVDRRRAEARAGGRPFDPRDAKAALERLSGITLAPRTTAAVRAHYLLRRGDLERLSGATVAAIATYEELLSRYAEESEEAAAAYLRLGTLFARLKEPTLQAEYYLGLFVRAPKEVRWLRRASEEVFGLFAGLPAPEQIERLRRLIDRFPRHRLFGALAQQRIAALHEQAGELELAIAALHEVTARYPELLEERTHATFALGRLSLARSEELRRTGRLGAALEFYGKALSAYERILRTFEPGHEHARQARSEYVRLSLLEGAQLERDGERVLAEKRYRRLLALDDSVVQAHRRLIFLEAARGQHRALEARYRDRLRRDPGDFLGHYALGLLATLGGKLAPSDLDRAEVHLKRAVDLAPQSPFGHLTLGWVYEMRERFAGQLRQGWLEEAILLYERAHGLNDAKQDLQTEADLLVNLCNAFAHLGNGWRQAYGFCAAREKLNLPSRSPQRWAHFHLIYGRAATATGHYEVADRQLDRALVLARSLRLSRLEAEVTARLALNAHLAGDYEASTRLFEETRTLFARLGRKTQLSGLSRSVAYNLLLQGAHDLALARLRDAEAELARHGTPPREDYSPIGPAGRSSAPFGFEGRDEAYLQQALRELVYEAERSWPEVRRLLAARLELRKAALAQRKDPELRRELLLLHNRLAFADRRLGELERFHGRVDEALRLAERAQRGEEGKEPFKPEGGTFEAQTALALNRAEALLTESTRDRAALVTAHRRLTEAEAWCAKAEARGEPPLLPARLRWSLWTDLALLELERADLPDGAPLGPPRTGAPAERATQRLAAEHAPYRRAMSLLRRVFRATRPLADGERDASEPGEAAIDRFHRPITPVERLRRHLLAGLNLAHVATRFTPRGQLEAHPSTRLLQALARLAVEHELGPTRFLVAAELSWRRRDLRAMQAAVDGFLTRSPLLLPPADRGEHDRSRRALFARAVELALAERQWLTALSFTEQEEQRAFVEALLDAGPAAVGPAREPLARLLAASARYQRVLAAQEPLRPRREREAWRTRLALAERQVLEAQAILERAAPRVGRLFSVEPVVPATVGGALERDELAVTALVHGDAAWLVTITPKGELRAEALPAGTATPTTSLDRRRAAVARLLRTLTAGAKRVYADLGRLDPALEPEALLGPRVEVVRLEGLTELVVARAARNVSAEPALVVGPEATARALANPPDKVQLVGDGALAQPRAPEITALPRAQATLAGSELPLERAGLLVWAAPLRHDGGSPANLRLLLPGDRGARLADLRLARRLGQPLRGRLIVFTAPELTPRHQRAQRQALLRLLHAMGMPSVALPSRAPSLDPLARRLAVRSQDHAEHAAASLARELELPLYGDGGLGGSAANVFARAALEPAVMAGARAANAGQQAQAIALLESALLHQRRLDDRKYRDGTLLYLGNAYTLTKDYARAVPRLEELVALRADAIQTAPKGPARLAAQAKWVQALQSMAWLRFRTKQLEQALTVNQQAIALYREVRRPLLAGPAYAQRSVIAEEKGDARQALAYAREQLEVATALLGPKPTPAARATASEAAVRVAQLERSRFSEYGRAMEAVRLAEAHAPTPATRVDALLERARLEGARGDYAAAVTQARRALELARTAKTPSEDAALLELVNNLYYQGAHERALAQADEGLRQAGPSPLRQLQFHNAKGTVLATLGRTDGALRSLGQALELAQRLGLPNEVAASHNNLGNAYRLAGRLEEARASFRRALAIDRRRDDRLGQAFSLANLGLTEEQLGRREEARASLTEALTLSRAIGAPLNALKAHLGLGRLHLRAGSHAEALAQFKTGHALAARLGLRPWLWRFSLWRGRALRLAGDLRGAERAFTEGLAVFEPMPPRLRRAIGSPEVDDDPDELYDELIQTLVDRGAIEPALDLLERLRGRFLVDLLTSSAQELQDATLRPALERVLALAVSLEAARSAATRTRDAAPPARRAAEAEVERLGAELAGARQALTALNPRLADLALSEVWPLAKLAPQLPRDRVMLCYHVGRRRLLIFALRAGRLTLHRVPVGRERLTREVERFRELVTRFHPSREAARRLYDWLLRPALAQGDPTPLTLVPSGPLHLLPFAALHDGGDELVARRPLAFLSRLNALRFAAPTAAAGSASALSVSLATGVEAPLPFVAHEAAAFARSFPGARLLRATEATRARLLAEAKAATTLHLATHGRYEPNRPLASTLRLADGELSLLDVLPLRLAGPLVILSACESGLGPLAGGDHLLGLPQAFFLAGARQVLSTLYRVSDLGAALLMKHLFRRLAAGLSPELALQAAQLQLRRRFPHPAFWAGFRLDGLGR
ncbi:MAG: CHAT domain-containing protein [Deltaproteobacteria bacterium]|nr:CHAT domain-containing protein [Deltaproteobacteria bacterium]